MRAQSRGEKKKEKNGCTGGQHSPPHLTVSIYFRGNIFPRREDKYSSSNEKQNSFVFIRKTRSISFRFKNPSILENLSRRIFCRKKKNTFIHSVDVSRKKKRRGFPNGNKKNKHVCSIRDWKKSRSGDLFSSRWFREKIYQDAPMDRALGEKKAVSSIFPFLFFSLSSSSFRKMSRLCSTSFL